MRTIPARSAAVRSFANRVWLRGPAMLALIVIASCTAPADVAGVSGNGTGGGTPPAVAARIDLSAATVGLGAVGATENVTAVVRDAAGTMLPNAAVNWSSDDITVADVSGAGRTAIITARAPGRTTIRATSGAATQELVVQVSIVRGIALPATVQLRTGSSATLTPTLDADAGATTAIRWESADPTIASVSAGVLTGIRTGIVTVRAIAIGDPRVSASTQVTVTAPRSVAIRDMPADLAIGEERQLTALVDVDENESRAVEWSSATPTIATVTSSGRLVAVGLGTARIRVRTLAFDGVRDSATVIVRMPRTVSVSPGTTTLAPGETRQLVAAVQIDDGMSTAVTWRVSDPAVAMVASTGLVTGVAPGVTTVTAVSVADTTRRGSATITVQAGVRSVSVSPAVASIVPGGTRQFTATVTGDLGVSTAVTWRTAHPAIAQVAANGLVTALAQGTTTITAVAVADTMIRSSATVTVVPVVRDLTVEPAAASISVGDTRQLVAAVSADPGANTAVTWRSANAAVATVSASGVVTGVSTGAAIITAVSTADTTRQATSLITVRTAQTVLGVTVTPAASVVQAGQSLQLVPAVQVSGGASTAVTYRSDNPAVASVNFAGLVTALTSGTATVTVAAVADPTRFATASITVTAPPTQLAASWSSGRLGGALYEDVVSVDAADATSAFAVNSRGDVFRLSGGTWALATRGSAHGTQFLAVSTTGPSSAVAVGTNGVIVQFNGSSWLRMVSGTQQALHGVHLEDEASGFAVGAGGLVLRLDGSGWTSMPSGSTQTLYSVWSLGNTGFIAGTNGELLRWNGTTWSRQSSGVTETLYGVHGVNANNAVAVGASGVVLRWNGVSWVRVTSGVTSDLYSVAGSAANNGRFYITSDDGLYALNGSTLSVAGTPYAPRLFGASIDPAGNVWASGQRGSVMRLSGSAWETVSLAPDLIDVWTTSPSNAWAVGEFGFVYGWNGSVWTRQTTPTTATLNAVWGVSASDAFAGGDEGTMLRWNGSSWNAMSFPSTAHVYGVWGTDASNVYAVTSNGEVLRFNGSSWTLVVTTASPLWIVHGAAANDVYVAGENGTAMRFNGTAWTDVRVPTTGTVTGIWAGGGANVLAVGSGNTGLTGVSFRVAGNTWNSVALPTASVLTSVWGPTANDVYATGEGGVILRWNGSGWTSMNSGTTDPLWSVSGSPNGTGGAFAVGYNSTVVAGGSSGAMLRAGVRVATGARTGSLAPRVGAKLVRGPLPVGVARRHRR